MSFETVEIKSLYVKDAKKYAFTKQRRSRIKLTNTKKGIIRTKIYTEEEINEYIKKH